MKLVTAESRYPHQPGLNYAERVVFHTLANPFPNHPEMVGASLETYLAGNPVGGALSERPTEVHPGEATWAEVRQGRWLVSCPWCLAGETRIHYQFAHPDDRRFFCTDCLNAAADGKWIPVVWPDDYADIDAVLAKRPQAAMRNWLIWESLEDLVAENEMIGV